MIRFLADCVSLFNSTFYAAVELGFFLLLVAVLVVQLTMGIFGAMSHRLRKM